LVFAFWPLGAVLIGVGALLWLYAAAWFPWKLVPKSKLELGITDVNFNHGGTGLGAVQLNVWVRNLGAPTILHSWRLSFEPYPGQSQRTQVIYDWDPEGPLAHLELLTEKTRREPLGVGLEKGLVCFVIPGGLTKETVARANSEGMIELSVQDQTARSWTVRKPLAELAALGVNWMGP
jgi:hypothetical protein